MNASLLDSDHQARRKPAEQFQVTHLSLQNMNTTLLFGMGLKKKDVPLANQALHSAVRSPHFSICIFLIACGRTRCLLENSICLFLMLEVLQGSLYCT